jgi:hypothetical protein
VFSLFPILRKWYPSKTHLISRSRRTSGSRRTEKEKIERLQTDATQNKRNYSLLGIMGGGGGLGLLKMGFVKSQKPSFGLVQVT